VKYQVIVYGSVLFESKDVLLADAYAHTCREQGKKMVTIKEVQDV